MGDRDLLHRFFKGLDNGDDVVFNPGTGATPGEAAFDAIERLQDQGHGEDDGVWLCWDRNTVENAFSAKELTGPLEVGFGGDRGRVEALLADLPEPFVAEIKADAHGDRIEITRPLSDDELAYPDPTDDAAAIQRLGLLQQQKFRHQYPKGYLEEGEPMPTTDGLSDADHAFIDQAYRLGSIKVQRAAMQVSSPRGREAAEALVADLTSMAKGDVAGELETILAVVARELPERLDGVVDQLAKMRGWAPRCAAAPYLAKREGAAGEAAEKLLHAWLSAKQRYEHSENVPGATRALGRLIARRRGITVAEALESLTDDETLSEGTRRKLPDEIGYAAREGI